MIPEERIQEVQGILCSTLEELTKKYSSVRGEISGPKTWRTNVLFYLNISDSELPRLKRVKRNIVGNEKDFAEIQVSIYEKWRKDLENIQYSVFSEYFFGKNREAVAEFAKALSKGIMTSFDKSGEDPYYFVLSNDLFTTPEAIKEAIIGCVEKYVNVAKPKFQV